MIATTALVLVTTTATQALSFSGRSSNDGMSFYGNSLQTSGIIWARGSTSNNFDVYGTHFNLAAGDSVNATGSDLLVGSPTGNLVDSDWQVGDKIVALGVLSPLGQLYGSLTFKIDFANSTTWAPATSIGGVDGIASFAGGGGFGTFQSQMLQAIPNNQYDPNANQYRDLSGTLFSAPGVGSATDYRAALKGFVVAVGSDPNTYTFSHAQFFINHTHLLRLGHPVAAIGPISKFSLGVEGTDVVVAQSVPEPATMTILALAAALKRRKAKKTQA
jgi:hypothetical protein